MSLKQIDPSIFTSQNKVILLLFLIPKPLIILLSVAFLQALSSEKCAKKFSKSPNLLACSVYRMVSILAAPLADQYIFLQQGQGKTLAQPIGSFHSAIGRLSYYAFFSAPDPKAQLDPATSRSDHYKNHPIRHKPPHRGHVRLCCHRANRGRTYSGRSC